jgi:hypothetical protein
MEEIKKWIVDAGSVEASLPHRRVANLQQLAHAEFTGQTNTAVGDRVIVKKVGAAIARRIDRKSGRFPRFNRSSDN